jgi:hypothetical protein
MKSIHFFLVVMTFVALAACSTSPSEQMSGDGVLIPMNGSDVTAAAQTTPESLRPTSTPTLSASPTSTSRPEFSLLEQYPDVKQVYRALNSFFGRNVYGYDDAFLKSIDLNGDAQDDLVYYNFTGYAMIWLGSGYSEPVPFYQRISGNSESNTRLMFEDLTGDGVAEIAFDSVQIYHVGSGLGAATWDRRIFHCKDQTCEEVLYFVLDHYMTDNNFGGTCRSHRIVSWDPIDRSLRCFSEGFSIYGCGETTGDLADMSTLRIDSSMVTYYRWGENGFEEVLTEAAGLEAKIDSQSRLFDERSDGTMANITTEFNMGAVSMNDACQLYISGNEVGDKFGCKSNFTQVEWQDITGDSEEELVVIAFSGATEFDLQGNDLGSQMCAHQHLLAYTIEAGVPRKIADIKGCTIESDLYGVKLTDIDGDGSLEIMTAGDPVASYWSEERNADCRDGHLIQSDDGSVQTCGFFRFDPLVSIYGWNGREYWPIP